MGRFLLAAVFMSSGCQLILGIDDKTADDNGGDDAGVGLGALCDPLTQAPCEPDEKCTSIIVPNSIPPISESRCADDGEIAVFDDCEPGDPIDDCVRGTVCLFGTCTPICEVEHGTCASGDTCFASPDLFSDRNGVAGGCQPQCDAVTQDSPVCFAEESCYINVDLAEAQCRPTPMSPAPQQGQPCFNDGNECFINSCDKGFGPHLASNQFADCSFYCTPVDTSMFIADFQFGDSDNGVACFDRFPTRPDGPGDFQCRFLQTFNGDLRIPETVGVCVDTSQFGNCLECDISSRQAADLTCPPGCLSQATIDGLPDEA